MEFKKNKEQICEIFLFLKNVIDNFVLVVDNINKGNTILVGAYRYIEVDQLKEERDTFAMSQRIVSRNKMKCVFFGKTSNGKSATINAVLGSEVVPSNIGRTTSCFITIEGCDENEAFLIDQKSQRRKIVDILDLADELENNEQDINSEIKVFWPKSFCEFLRKEIILLDSPGVDYSPRNDRWIEKFCEDADIFVYVVDGGSTIHEAERKFFRRVKYLLSTPKIFIVMNKWDQCRSGKDESAVEKLKNQHRETARKFFNEDLRLPCDLNRRLFFISAKEALESALDEQSEQSDDFNEFIQILLEELSANALITKFKPPLLRALEFVEKYSNSLEKSFEKSVSSEVSFSESEFRALIRKMIRETFSDIRNTSKEKIEEQYSTMVPSISDDQNSSLIHSFVFPMLQNFMSKILRDSFLRNIESLSIKIKEELLKISPLRIEPCVFDSYSSLEFRKYLDLFQRHISANVSLATKELRPVVKSEGNQNPVQPLVDALPILSKHIIPAMKFEEKWATVVMNMVCDLHEKNEQKRLEEKRKKEAEKIPDSTIKRMIIGALIQLVDEYETDIERDAISEVDRFLRDRAEAWTVLKSIDGIKSQLTDIKIKLMGMKEKLEGSGQGL